MGMWTTRWATLAPTKLHSINVLTPCVQGRLTLAIIFFVKWVVSPRFEQVFDEDGKLPSDQGMIEAFNDMTLFGVEPQVVLNYGSEAFRFRIGCRPLVSALSGSPVSGSRATFAIPLAVVINSWKS